MRSVTLDEAPPDQRTGAPSKALVVAAFAAVYLIWGSTFLGIAVAIQSIPPLLMSGVRWLVAGALLLAVLRMRGVPWPEPVHWRNAVLIGALLLGIGNGGMTWAQQSVPSGITALIIAAVPLWTILFDWLRPQGRHPHRLVYLGLALGFVGVVLIIMGKDHGGSRMVAPIPGVGAAAGDGELGVRLDLVAAPQSSRVCAHERGHADVRRRADAHPRRHPSEAARFHLSLPPPPPRSRSPISRCWVRLSASPRMRGRRKSPRPLAAPPTPT